MNKEILNDLLEQIEFDKYIMKSWNFKDEIHLDVYFYEKLIECMELSYKKGRLDVLEIWDKISLDDSKALVLKIKQALEEKGEGNTYKNWKEYKSKKDFGDEK